MKTNTLFCHILALSILVLTVTPGWLICMDGSNKKRTHSQTEQQEEGINRLLITCLLNAKEKCYTPRQKPINFTCEICKEVFNDNDSLANHYFPNNPLNQRVSPREKTLKSDCFQKLPVSENKCRICKKTASNEWIHINMAHIRPIVCKYPDCVFRTGEQSRLDNHMLKYHKTQQLLNSQSMENHTNTRPIDPPDNTQRLNAQLTPVFDTEPAHEKQPCSQTDLEKCIIHKSSINYLLNSNEELTKPAYVCKTCSRNFDDNSSLMNHYFPTIPITNLHGSFCFKSIVYPENKCPLCDLYVEKKHLLIHINGAHIDHKESNSGRFACGSCAYRCTSQKILEGHLCTHNNVEHDLADPSIKHHTKPCAYETHNALKKIQYPCRGCKRIFDNDSLAHHYFPNHPLNKAVNCIKTYQSDCFRKLPVSKGTCRICCNSIKDEWKHINKVHIKPNASQYCSFRAGEKKDLVDHLLKYHKAECFLNSLSIEQPNKTQFTCAQCAHVFDTESAYQKHECTV